MSKYNVAWDKKSRTLTIQDVDAKASKGAETVSNIVYGDLGDIPDSSSHPEPGQHLRNIARQQGIENFDLVTVVNDTDNERLNRFEQEADEKAVELFVAEEARKVLDKPTGSLERKAIENADKADPMADEIGDQIENDETPAQKKAREDRAKADAEKAGKAGGENGAADSKADQKAHDSKDTVQATAGGVKNTK